MLRTRVYKPETAKFHFFLQHRFIVHIGCFAEFHRRSLWDRTICDILPTNRLCRWHGICFLQSHWDFLSVENYRFRSGNNPIGIACLSFPLLEILICCHLIVSIVISRSRFVHLENPCTYSENSCTHSILGPIGKGIC